MRILLTGSNGLLGQKIIEAIQQDATIDLLATAIGPNRFPDLNGYRYAELDITDEEAVYETIADFKPDVVINAAAMTNVDACETEQELCQKLNVDAVSFIVKACCANNAHLIHLSTDFIFDGLNGPYKESDLPDPGSVYARSKWESEKIVMAADCQWTIIRTILVYGVLKGGGRSNIVLWALNALRSGKEITVIDDQFRAPTLSEDLAAACIAVAKKHKLGIYHISGATTYSVLEIVQKVAEHFSLPKSLIKAIKTKDLNQLAHRPPRTGFIIEKAKAELAYAPHTFEQGLDLVEQQLKQLETENSN